MRDDRHQQSRRQDESQILSSDNKLISNAIVDPLVLEREVASLI